MNTSFSNSVDVGDCSPTKVGGGEKVEKFAAEGKARLRDSLQELVIDVGSTLASTQTGSFLQNKYFCA